MLILFVVVIILGYQTKGKGMERKATPKL